MKYLIRDREGKYPALFDAILADAGRAAHRRGLVMTRLLSCRVTLPMGYSCGSVSVAGLLICASVRRS